MPAPLVLGPHAPTCRGATMPLVIVIHAFGGHPEKFWYPRLQKALADDARVEVLRMTDPSVPRISAWVKDLARRAAEAADEAAAATSGPGRIYLVGHSVGCQTIARFLSMPATAALLAGGHLQLCGVLCVAAWFEVVDPWETIEPWCTTPIDTASARCVLEAQGAPLVVLLSDDDKYTPNHVTNATQWRERLGAVVQTLPGRKHFSGRNQPQIIAVAQQLLRIGVRALAAPPLANCAELPVQLLTMVLSNLPSPLDLAHAERVCHSWLAAAVGSDGADGCGGLVAEVADGGAWRSMMHREFSKAAVHFENEYEDSDSHGRSWWRVRYHLAAKWQRCTGCRSLFQAGANGPTSCGYHPGIVISGTS